MRFPRRPILALLSLVGCVFAPAGTARAKSEFVNIIATHLALPYVPPCSICHIQGTTGPGSVQTPFGMSMLAHGLSKDQGTVAPALDGLAADMTDSDGDGVSDIAELMAGTNPNTAAPVRLGPNGSPTYGCAVAPVDAGPGSSAASALAGALVAAGLCGHRLSTRRRRRRGGDVVHRSRP